VSADPAREKDEDGQAEKHEKQGQAPAQDEFADRFEFA